jgi:hypothetical protein
LCQKATSHPPLYGSLRGWGFRALLAKFEKDGFEPGLMVVDTLARVALGAEIR